MKQLKLFFALFAMLALGVGNAWAEVESITEDFEKQTAGTTYNTVKQYEESTSNASIAWYVEHGIVSTNNKLSGNQSLQMRAYYAKNSATNVWNGALPYLESKTPIKGLANITFNGKVGNTTLKVDVMYSTDGLNWTNLATAASYTTSSKQYSYDIPNPSITNDYYIKIAVNSSSTHAANPSKSGNIALIVDDITFTYETSGSTEPVLTSIQISGELTKDTYEEGDELDLTGLTVQANYESGDPKDVTNDVEWSYEPLTAGQTSVTVTATYEGLTAIKTINDLTVTEHVVTPGEKCTGTLGYAFWGLTAEKLTATANEINYTKEFDDVTVNIKNGQKANAYFKSDHTRVYSGGYTMTFSVPNGYIITNIAFTAIGSYWEGNHTANVGTMSDNKNWTGANQNVTITFNGSCRIASICVTYKADVKYALTITEPTEGGTLVVKDGENTLASGAEIYEGTKLTVTATPATGYEEGVVVVKNASDEDVTAAVYEAGTLTMPAYAVTISATFDKKPCTLLATPTVSATTTYSSATLTWDAVADAAKYSVTVGETTTEVTEPTYTATGLNAETTYTYQVQAIAEADQDTYCDSEVAEGSFTTTAAPVATLTLSDIEGTTTQTGALNGTITLPTTAAECSKTFVGWDADENCDHAPTYAPGAEYTFTTVDPTLYAVYADGEAGEALQWTIKNDDLKVLDSSQNSGYAKYAGDQEKDGVTFNITSVMPATGENDGKIQMQAEKATIYNKTAMPGNIISIAIDGVDLSVYEGTEVISSTPSSGAITKNSEVYNFSSGKRYFHLKKSTKSAGYANSITVTYASAPTYSNYSTTCAAALEKPTFSVAEGTYTEAKSIELNATEGDIYYTLDGTDPTASSTQYTTAIVLDECGTTTIKAIAISTESQSPIASATYTINLPITNTAATAYTPAEAIAIIDGACDKSEEVYVKGVVVSTSEFNATYGNYDVIVKAVDDNSATPTTFTFYHMYKAASNTKFIDSDEVIGVGDIITAKGKLTKFYSTYEFEAGCYMVERLAFTDPKTDISNTEETAYTVDKAFELISDIKSDLDKEVYVKGIVAVASTELYEEKYLTYSISDNGQNSGNVLKVYDGLDINGVAFTSKDDVKVGDYVVVKGKLLNYKGTYEINKDNQLVQHVKAATITIADITMEVGETKTIAVTITPAAAETAVKYTIKENAANAISLSNNVITANAVGTATITATIATAADYMGKTVDFTVTVNAKSTKEKVVILAKYGDQWYAMMAQYVSGKTSHLAALPVTYVGGKLYNVADADKSLIEWERAIVDGKATFKNGSNYLTGKSGKTDLTLATTAYEWTIDGDSYLTGDRTFLYNAENNWFRHFGISNAGNKNYSGMPVVTAPVYATGQAYGRTSAAGKFGTICLPFGSTNYTGATFYEFVGSETGKVYLGSVTTLEAGVPYIFEASAAEVAVYGDGTTAATPGNSKGLHGTFTDETPVAIGNYILLNNELRPSDGNAKVNANRAYIVMSEVPTGVPTQMPGRRYIGMSVQGENETTGVEDLFTTDAPVKVIENGQLIIIRDGVKYNVQGQVIR